MSCIYIHAGTIKTGTSFIQKMLLQNTEALEKYDISYPFVSHRQPDVSRYANADFVLDPSKHKEARELFANTQYSRTVISEEGLFNQVEYLVGPSFSGLNKKIILYVRRPAELLASWAAEYTKTYNAFISHHPSDEGPKSIEKGIGELSERYEINAREFLESINKIGPERFIVRSYERERFKLGSLFADFLDCLGVDIDKSFLEKLVGGGGSVNVSDSRRFCDISLAIWGMISKNPELLDRWYNPQTVAEVRNLCNSGDDRPVVETLSDDQIEEISERFEFFENAISDVLLGGQPLFVDRYPACYLKKREAYRAIDLREVESLLEQIMNRV